MSGIEIQSGLVWLKQEGDDVTVGLTLAGMAKIGFAQEIEFPSEGESISESDHIVTVDGSNGRIEIESPSDGTIEEVNWALKEDPENLGEDPYDEGWLIKFRPKNEKDFKEKFKT